MRKKVANSAARHIRNNEPKNTSCFGASSRVVATIAGTVSTELGGRGYPAPFASPDSISLSREMFFESVGNVTGPVLGVSRNR